MKQTHNRPGDDITGNICAVSAFTIWGALTFYWKALGHVPALYQFLHRILWCLGTMLIYTLIRSKTGEFRGILARRRTRIILPAAGLLISTNWFLYIFSVSTGQILQASLAYYINPLMSIFLGMVFLKERLSRRQTVSLICAGIGVLIMTVSAGLFPWLSICMATTFSLYGLIKKTVNVPSDMGLTMETLFLAPPAALWLVLLHHQNGPLWGTLPPLEAVLLPLSGIITAVPLLLFAEGVKRIPLSRLGFIQFISPTIMFFAGMAFGEPLPVYKIISFAFIWTAVILFLLPRRSLE